MKFSKNIFIHFEKKHIIAHSSSKHTFKAFIYLYTFTLQTICIVLPFILYYVALGIHGYKEVQHEVFLCIMTSAQSDCVHPNLTIVCCKSR